MPFKMVLWAMPLCGCGVASAADKPDPFAPMSFLAGNCWQGAFAGTTNVGRHCFTWVFEGKILRDRHRVSPAEGVRNDATDYRGETIYSVDPKTKQLIYRYFNSAGEIIDGNVEIVAGKLVFPALMQTAQGVLKIRATWTLKGADAYEVSEEQISKGSWAKMFTGEMKRSGPAEREPAFP